MFVMDWNLARWVRRSNCIISSSPCLSPCFRRVPNIVIIFMLKQKFLKLKIFVHTHSFSLVMLLTHKRLKTIENRFFVVNSTCFLPSTRPHWIPFHTTEIRMDGTQDLICDRPVSSVFQFSVEYDCAFPLVLFYDAVIGWLALLCQPMRTKLKPNVTCLTPVCLTPVSCICFEFERLTITTAVVIVHGSYFG